MATETTALEQMTNEAIRMKERELVIAILDAKTALAKAITAASKEVEERANSHTVGCLSQNLDSISKALEELTK